MNNRKETKGRLKMKQRVHPKIGERIENVGIVNGKMLQYKIPILDIKRFKIIEHTRPVK